MNNPSSACSRSYTPSHRRGLRLRSSVVGALVAVSSLASQGTAYSQIPSGATTVPYNLDVYSDGTYEAVGTLLLPSGYDPAASTKYPMVVVYHGYGEWGTNNVHMTKNIGDLLRRGYGLRTDGTALPNGKFFVYAPQAPTQGWNLPKQKDTIRILGKILSEYKVDQTQMYITGLSNGGGATWSVGCRYFDIFAAAVPICGASGTQVDHSKLVGEHIWAHHARNDQQAGALVQRSRDKINWIRQAQSLGNVSPWPLSTDPDWFYHDHYTDTPPLLYSEYQSGGHAIWDDVYKKDEVYDWLRGPVDGKTQPVTTLQPGETMLFDFGNTECLLDNSGRHWNSISGTGSERTLLICEPFAKTSVTGVRKFVHAEVTGKFTGGVNTGGTLTSTIYDHENISKDSWYTSTAAAIGKVTIRGLAPGASYDLRCFASVTITDGTSRLTTYRAEGKSADLETANNPGTNLSTDTALLSNVIAKSDGTIDLEVQAKSPSTRGHLGVLELTRNAAATTTVYSQNFSSGTTLSTYVDSTTPASDKMNEITSEWSVVNNAIDPQVPVADGGALRVIRSTTATTTPGFTRLQQTGNAPAAIKLQFDLKFTGTQTASNDLAVIDLGTMTTLQGYAGGTPNTGVGNRLQIKGSGSNLIRFYLNGKYASNGTIPTFAVGTTWEVTWVQNLSSSPVTYTDPNGVSTTVGAGLADFWVGNTQIFNEEPRPSIYTGATLGAFRMRVPTLQNLSIYIDNFDYSKF